MIRWTREIPSVPGWYVVAYQTRVQGVHGYEESRWTLTVWRMGVEPIETQVWRSVDPISPPQEGAQEK